MTQRELAIVQRMYRPTRTPTPEEYAELLGLVRYLGSMGCTEPGVAEGGYPCLDKRRGRSRKADLCAKCHAIALLVELELGTTLALGQHS